ncbi:hypothetical protein BC937DRAFT_88087, partial [Endogone sp. FLAS-F59071]
ETAYTKKSSSLSTTFFCFDAPLSTTLFFEHHFRFRRPLNNLSRRQNPPRHTMKVLVLLLLLLGSLNFVSARFVPKSPQKYKMMMARQFCVTVTKYKTTTEVETERRTGGVVVETSSLETTKTAVVVGAPSTTTVVTTDAATLPSTTTALVTTVETVSSLVASTILTTINGTQVTSIVSSLSLSVITTDIPTTLPAVTIMAATPTITITQSAGSFVTPSLAIVVILGLVGVFFSL